MDKTILDELKDLPSDGEKIDDIEKEEEEKETPSESSTEEKQEDEEEKEETSEEVEAREKKEQEEEDALPFHKHPRFKALIEERNKEKEDKETFKKELESLREDTESKFSEIKESQSQTTKIPEWFVESFGENEAAWAKYEEHSKSDRVDLKKEIMEEIKGESQKKEDDSKKWDEWIDTEIGALKDSGKTFEKNDLMKIMMDYKPSDEKGNLDFEKGYEIMELKKAKDPKKSKARKEIVDDSGKSSKDPESKPWKTPEDMRGVGWGNIND